MTRNGEKRRRRRVPMRIWLGAAFAGVSLITAASVYVFVDASWGRTLQSESADLAVGKTSSLADDLSKVDKLHAANVLATSNTSNFQSWAVNRHGNPYAPGQNFAALDTIEQKPEAIRLALAGRSFRASLPGNVTVVGAPIFGPKYVRGAVVAHADPPPALTRAFDQLRGDRLRALLIAIAIGALVGFIVATLIAIRVRRLARAAEQMAAGRFDAPLPRGGSDEVGDLTRPPDGRRRGPRKPSGRRPPGRARLSAIFDGLTEGVIVVGEDGKVRFANPAASRLVRDGQPASALVPSLRRA